MAADRTRNTEVLTLAVLLVGACWFAAWPYMGLWHDARLYALEALARLKPGVFDRDLFLAYGSQGGFTLFPGLLAGLIKWLGLEYAVYSLALAGKLFWFAALVWLARQLMPAPIWVVAVLPVLAFPAFYDSHQVFSYGESFATPRIFAEGFVLLALAAWARGRMLAAAGLLGVAGLMHPLMALPGGAVLALLAWGGIGNKHRIWLALAGLAALLAALAFHPDLASRLVTTYDPAWFEAVRLRNPFVFLDKWNVEAIDRMAWLALVLGLVVFEETGRLKRLALTMLLATCGLLALSWLGAVVFHNILLTQLQLWRVLWLASVIALLLLGPLLIKLWQSDYASRILAVCLVAAYVNGADGMFLIAMAGLVLRWIVRRIGPSIAPGRPLWWALPFLMLLPWIIRHLLELPQQASFVEVLSDRSAWRAMLGDRVVLVLVGLIAYWAAVVTSRHAKRVMLLPVVAAWALAAWSWQPREAIAVSTDTRAMLLQMKQDISPGAVVQSTAGGADLWFVLERPRYVSQLQTSGALFNRDTALVGVKRLRLLGRAGFPAAHVEWHDDESIDHAHLTTESVNILCGDPELDYVVLGGLWKQAQHLYQSGSRSLSLFACKGFR